MQETSRVALFGLVVAGSLLAVLGVISNATASPSLRSVGVAVLQFGCGLNISSGNLYGPATVPMNAFGDCPGRSLATVPTPVPKGGLYALRVNSVGGTTAGQLPVLEFTVYDGITLTPLSCTTTTTSATCSDFTASRARQRAAGKTTGGDLTPEFQTHKARDQRILCKIPYIPQALTPKSCAINARLLVSYHQVTSRMTVKNAVSDELFPSPEP